MKKLILLFLLIAATVFAIAQKNEGNPEARIQKRVDRMTEQLKLSEAQQTQIKKLFATQQQHRMVDGKKWSDLSAEEREAMSAKHKAGKAEFDGQLAQILTQEQNETYKNLPKRSERKGSYKAKGKKGEAKKTSAERIENRVGQLTEKLDLNATQQAQLNELLSSQNKTRMAGGKGMKDLSGAEREAHKAERKATMESFTAQFEKILTPDQLLAYQKLKEDRKVNGKKNWEKKKSRGRK